ncbi:hypothetical protein GOODEAATRI_000773 [Goodea atripinnis]|uniref:Uncharacterized protein n=1 Tax=Goodea atripinnis TaxID=208336 RepID=A0ABV0PJP6_9TELE
MIFLSQSVIYYSASSIVGSGEAGAYLQQSMGGDTAWTGRQSIAGQHRHIQDKQPHTHSFTPKANVARPINLVMFLDCGRKPESNPGPSCCKATVLPTVAIFLSVLKINLKHVTAFCCGDAVLGRVREVGQN